MLTRSTLIEEVSRVCEITRKDAAALVEAMLGSIACSLRRGEDVEIRRFGHFQSVRLEGRVWKHPASGLEYVLPAKRVIRFRAAQEVRTSLLACPADGAVIIDERAESA